MPNEIEAVGAPPVVDEPPETIAPIPPGSNLPALVKSISPRLLRILKISISAAALILFLLWIVLGRRGIAASWPFMDKFYDAVGLHIYHYGEGLTFEQVRSELRYDGGITELWVEGKIRNGSQNVQDIPNILAAAIGADGKPIQSWQIDAPAIRVFSGEAMPFHSTIKAPEGTVTEINLSFVEMKHDNER